MKVDTMRKIDYWAGIPLCILFSIFVKPLQWLNSFRKKDNKALLIELSEMGSAILVDPAMDKLKSNNYELFFLIFEKNKVSLSLLQTVEDKNIFTIRDSNFWGFLWDTIKFCFWVQKQNFDLVIDLELFSRFTAILTAVSGAKKRVGFHPYHNEGVFRGWIHNVKVWYNSHIHIAKNFIALVDAALSDKKQLPFSKSLILDSDIVLKKSPLIEKYKPIVIEKIEKIIGEKWEKSNTPIVLINANASDLLPQRRWSKKSYIEFINIVLTQLPKSIVLLTGSKSEGIDLQTIVLAVNNNRCFNFAGEVSFKELPSLYSLSHFMLSNDSGPPHFASVTDLPTFTIFGPETPKLYGAIGSKSYFVYLGLSCSPCVSAWNHRKTACTDNQCLIRIHAQDVFAQIKSHEPNLFI